MTPDSARDEADIRQISLRRIKEFAIKPKRDLGQNFLIDNNILEVALGLLEARPDDVILEIGAGLGVLTKVLSSVGRTVHAFEVDRTLEGPLTATLAGCDNVQVHFQDVLKASLAKLDPAPTLCASNLPYSVAGPFLIEALWALPTVRRYCVMIQREVADRIAAAPGSKAYGTLSVWVQLYATVSKSRPVARTVFYPVPHVDSSILVLDRLPAGQQPDCDPDALRQVIQSAFGQRRKTLVNALSSAASVSKDQAQSMVRFLGLPANIRAEALLPGQFVELAKSLREEPAT